jgi:sigma54-dependent transcription regulator
MSEVRLFGQRYDADGSTISVQHTLTVEQARRIEALCREATTLQEALRMLAAQSLQSRKALQSSSDIDEVRQILERIDSRIAGAHNPDGDDEPS